MLDSNTRWGRKKAFFSRSGPLQVDVLERPDSKSSNLKEQTSQEGLFIKKPARGIISEFRRGNDFFQRSREQLQGSRRGKDGHLRI